MSAPAVAAVIIAVALGTLLFFLYVNQTGDQQEPEQEQEQLHSYSNIRDNNVRRSTRWSDDDDECTICYTPLRSENCMTLACSHSYHKKCIETWKLVSSGSPSCPICRHKF